MLIRPIATEKAYHEQTKRGYMFVVQQLASAVVSMPILVQLIVKTRKLLLLLLKRATKSRSLTRSQ